MPRFIPGWGPARKIVESEALYQGRNYDVRRAGERVWLHANAKWTKHFTAAVERYGVNTLIVSRYCAAHGLEFLDDLPGVTDLSVSVPLEPPDLAPLRRMTWLERLSLSPGSLVSINPPGEIDFTAFPKLIVCDLAPWWPQWESVLNCRNLRGLHVTESRTPASLDLSRLEKLEELVLGGLTKLASFTLAPKAKVTSMQLRSCGKLQPDWPRIGRDLLYLWLEKKPPYPLTELRHARKLKRLMLGYFRKLDPPHFLNDLPALEKLELLFTEFDPEGLALVRSMKHLHTDGLPLANPGNGSPRRRRGR